MSRQYQKHGMMTKLIILNLMLTSSLITLTILMLKDRGLKDIVELMSSKFVGNGSDFHFYSKEDPATVDLDSLCKNIETHRTSEISVWKTALTHTQRLPTDLDVAYHAYIVYETEDPMGVKHYWSQEKQRDRLVLQHSLNKEDVVNKMNGENRLGEGAWKTEPELLLQDHSTFGAVPRYSILS